MRKKNARNKLEGKYKQMLLCRGNGKEITDIREAAIEIHCDGGTEECLCVTLKIIFVAFGK